MKGERTLPSITAAAIQKMTAIEMVFLATRALPRLLCQAQLRRRLLLQVSTNDILAL